MRIFNAAFVCGRKPRTWVICLTMPLGATLFASIGCHKQQQIQQKSSATPAPPPPRRTPILMRGGSMTAFTQGSNIKWIEITPDQKYCVVLPKPNQIELDFADQADPSSSLPWPLGSASTSWQVNIYGHDPSHYDTGDADRRFGIKFDWPANSAKCNPNPQQIAILITAMGGGFYKKTLPADPNRYYDNKRFSVSPLYCIGTDEDFCERMALVEVAIDGNLQSSQGKCLDGDCSLQFVTQ